MKNPHQIRYMHALLILMGVLLVASLIANSILVAQQRKALLGEAERFAHRELKLMETFIRDALIGQDYRRVEQFFQQWAQEDPNVVAFRAVARDLQSLIDYQRPLPALQQRQLALTHEVHYGGQLLATLSLIRDTTTIENNLDQMRVRLVIASTLFVLVLATFLWVMVRQMALIPQLRLEEELKTHRYRLERSAQERTRKLNNTIRQLQREIDERERLHEQMSHRADGLEQRMASRTTELQATHDELEAFTWSVSHALRNQLWQARSAAEQMQHCCRQQLPDEGHQALQQILESSRSMEMLIRDLLTYSRLNREPLSLQPLSLQRVVETALEQLDEVVRQRHATITVDTPLDSAVGDYATLLLVITHLLENSLTFVAADRTPQIQIGSQRYRHWTLLWISDNGLGIPNDDQERIFRRFERLHDGDSYPGTGLGLAIVLRGVARLGGLVGVEAEAAGGSRFWIALPIITDVAAV